ADPTYVIDGVVHYCVANMPGAVPRTSTFALTNATAPYARKLAKMGAKAAAADPLLGTAANVLAGQVTHDGVAAAFGMECVAAGRVLGATPCRRAESRSEPCTPSSSAWSRASPSSSRSAAPAT